MSNLESGSFELPSAKRLRYEHTETEIVQVSEPTEVETVTIATEEVVPSSQFEIEINSQTDDGDSVEQQDLGPNFRIVHDTQEIHTLSNDALSADLTSEDGSTLNAIGHALIQMQQGGQTTPTTAGSQLILTRSTSSSSESGGNAPLYVMIPPASSAEILHAMSRPAIAPKGGVFSAADFTDGSVLDVAANREAQRKATHNEVERRRRDRINELIKVLAQIVPACQKKDATTGSIVGYVYSKGTVLDKTVDYLKDLMTQNEQLAAGAKIAEKSTNAVAVLQNQISVLEKENAFLRAQIIQFGIDAAASSGQKQPVNQLLNSSLAQSLLSTVATQSPPLISALPLQQSPPQTSNGAAQQLLLSLAQNLTNSPLLTSLAQQQLTNSPMLTSPAQNQPTASPLLTSLAQNQATAAASSLLVSPSQNHQGPILAVPPSQLEFGGTVVIPSLAQPSLHVTPSQFSSISPLLQTSLPSSNPNTPLLSSLVQTLSSMANTSTSPSSSPIPKSSLSPQSSNGGTGLSAAAAASLLNTLIIAQNVLSGTGGPGASSTEGLTMETVEQVPQQ